MVMKCATKDELGGAEVVAVYAKVTQRLVVTESGSPSAEDESKLAAAGLRH